MDNGSKAVVHRLGVLALGQERDGTVRIAASASKMAHGSIVRQSVRGSRRWPSRQYRDGLPRRACDLRKRDARRVRRSPPRSAPADPLPRAIHSSRSMTPRCLFDLWGSWQIRESNSRCSPAEPSGKVPDTHSVDSICDHDFGVFTVTNIATENTDAVLPAHPLPRTPKAANRGFQRCRGPSVFELSAHLSASPLHRTPCEREYSFAVVTASQLTRSRAADGPRP
jgi:hypothetical protein